ncbi:MAG: hypothetical protein HWD61_06060 [Parachlamydiaceae bacterium]|nr:MAG: hypothetical protein HWD61_06060 [Parachlamydiaceae bacterium]
MLTNAVASAKKLRMIKTIYHEKFEELQSELNKLPSVLDWLISIRTNDELLYFVEKLFEIGDQYSPRFKLLYEDLNGIYWNCLTSMQKVQVDEENKNALKQILKTGKC